MYSNAIAIELINTSIQAGSQAPIRAAMITPTIKAAPKIHFALLETFVASRRAIACPAAGSPK